MMEYSPEVKNEIVRLRVEERLSNLQICEKVNVGLNIVKRTLKGLKLTKHEKSILNSKHLVPEDSKFLSMTEEELYLKREQCLQLRSENLKLKHINMITGVPISTISDWLSTSTSDSSAKKEPDNERINKNFSLNEFKEIIASSISVRESLLKMGLCGTGARYTTFYKRVRDNNIDTSHFKGMGHGKANSKLKVVRMRPLETILVYGKSETGAKLREKLIKAGIKKRQCEAVGCGLTEWHGKPAPLQVHHIDGDKLNNVIENLQFLCANCHFLTENFGSKNKNKKH